MSLPKPAVKRKVGDELRQFVEYLMQPSLTQTLPPAAPRTLHREADAAIVEAQVLENVETLNGAIEKGKSMYVNLRSYDSFVTWRPAVKDISQSQPIDNKPKSEKAESMHLPAPNLTESTTVKMRKIDINEEVVEYWMKVHVFRNGLLPWPSSGCEEPSEKKLRSMVPILSSSWKSTSMLMMAWYPYHLKLRQQTCSNGHRPRLLNQIYSNTSLYPTVRQSWRPFHPKIVPRWSRT
ncbi:hypothetical protein F2P81_004989 [Scophthalmus maximus]|uniref:Uncharacterized protein n=1 Tax=Scophthalmus maximus TaxID=52904 RepID=A0A6A4TNW6_SCOMX|nr:hypothetical protein F2P81_004989 [Scophthalmus maximus]